MGDGMMVFWGAPNELSKDEQLSFAVSCAKEMQRSMLELNEIWKDHEVSDLKMRIGINHGPAVVGNFGNEKRSDYSAIGPSVNLASRIESVCRPGEIFISGDFCARIRC